MAYFGKEFKLDRQENYDFFVNALNGGNVNEQYKQALIAHKPTIKIIQSGDGYTLFTKELDNSILQEHFKSGDVYQEDVGMDVGEDSKTTITFEGNVCTKVMKFAEGTITIKREFNDNELVATYTIDKWDGKAVRYFKP